MFHRYNISDIYKCGLLEIFTNILYTVTHANRRIIIIHMILHIHVHKYTYGFKILS